MSALTAVRALAAAALLSGAFHAQVPAHDDVLAALDALRADPRGYAASLAAFEALFDGPAALEYRVPGDESDHVTHEGVVAIAEARRVLLAQPPLAPLTFSRMLSDAARDHVEEQQDSGALGHLGARGDTPGDRVKRRGGDIYVAEASSYGSRDGADVVRQLVVDDGVPRRGHRTLLLASAYRYVGIACGHHPTFRTMCVLDFAQTPDGSPKLPETR